MSLLMSASPKEAVLSLINANNTLDVAATDQNLYFGVPRQAADGVTILPAVGVLGSAYEGTTEFRYRRINLSTAYGDVRPIVRGPGEHSLYELLDRVNSVLGLSLTTDDVYDRQLTPVAVGHQVYVSVLTKPTSLGYTGKFVFEFYKTAAALDDYVTAIELPPYGNPIAPTATLVSIDMATWGMDFTADRARLARNPTGDNWLTPSDVQALALENGFADFPLAANGDVLDVATVDYPSANPEFDRVAIQLNVAAPTYEGTAYFHYNVD